MAQRLSPTDREPADHVAVRLDEATQARIRALEPYYTQAWHRATLSDILRGVILAGLDVEEARVKELARMTALAATQTAKKTTKTKAKK